MMYFSRLKTTLIVLVCVLGALLCVPNMLRAPAAWLPWRSVHLGLDLQGGSYLLLEIDSAAVVKERLDGLADSARQALRAPNILAVIAPKPEQQQVVVRLRDPSKLAAATEALRQLTVDPTGTTPPGIDLASTDSTGEITLTLNQAGLTQRANQAVQQSIEIVRRRIDETGVLDPQITRQGSSRINVQLPGLQDPQRIRDLLGRTAHMTFRLVDDSAAPGITTPPPGDDILEMDDDPQTKLAVRKRVDLDGGLLTDARATTGQEGDWVVSFAFNAEGARRFADISSANVGHRFAVVLDNKVITAPQIREPIRDGRGQISGHFTAASANTLAVLLRAGALPAPLKVVEERSVGPELGADSIRVGAISLIFGFFLVVAYMGIFYGLFGWFANLALVVNLVLMLAVLSLLEATLTLPGMAGILLTLGMAVDANILIYERIREETRNGRGPLQALDAGFTRAYSTIFDSNATTFLAHFMLFLIGSGPVKGFAVTITVGIATTMFTAWMLTRLFISRWYIATRPQTLPV